MKLVYPKSISSRQEDLLRLSLEMSDAKPSRSELQKSIAAYLSRIEPGACVIESNFPVSGSGAIDLLCADSRGYPVVIDIAETLDSEFIANSAHRLDWIFDNLNLMDKLMPDIKWGKAGSLWIFADSVCPKADSLLRRLAEDFLSVFLYRALVLEGERWLLVRRNSSAVEGECDSGLHLVKTKKSDYDGMRNNEKTSGPAGQTAWQSVLTDDEIDNFFKEHEISDDEDATSWTTNIK